MKKPIYISALATLGMTLTACQSNAEPTAETFTKILSGTTEKQCTDLSEGLIDARTYYNNVRPDPSSSRYRMAREAGILEDKAVDGRIPTNAKFREVLTKIDGNTLCDGSYSDYVAQTATRNDDGTYTVTVTRKFTPEPWAEANLMRAFFLDKPTTTVVYQFKKEGNEWKGTGQPQPE